MVHFPMIIWLLIALVLVFAEIATLNLVFASFAVGAALACLVSLATENLLVQSAALVVGACLSLFILRPVVLAKLYRREHKTGFDKLIGQQGMAIEDITLESGSIRIHGDVWTARTKFGEIPAGHQVTLKEIVGALVIVESSS